MMRCATPSLSVCVIGVGNPDRGDDGAGPEVARRLAGRLPDDVRVLVRGGDMTQLSDDVAGVDALVCVDAAAPRGVPGRVSRIDSTETGLEALALQASPASSHAFGLAESLALADALGLAPRVTIVYALEGACFDPGAPLTPAVAAAVETVVERVIEEVERLRRAPSTEVPDA